MKPLNHRTADYDLRISTTARALYASERQIKEEDVAAIRVAYIRFVSVFAGLVVVSILILMR
jgi:hypothetical protein